jgi:ATP-dependent DNA ligase
VLAPLCDLCYAFRMNFRPQNAKTAKTLTEAASKCADPVMELKYDGWRLIVTVEESGPRLWSRTGKEYTGRVPEIEAELAKLPTGTVLDGEIVDLKTHDYISVTNVFGKSKAVASDEERLKLSYVAFDILNIGYADKRRSQSDGSVATLAFGDRKQYLIDELADHKLNPDLVSWSEWYDVDQTILDGFYAKGLEGAIVKDRVMPYMRGKRGHGWFKIKGTEECDVIITDLPKNGNGKYIGLVGHMIVSQYDEDNLVQVASVNCPDDATRKDMTLNPDKYVGRVLTLKHYGKIIDGFRHPNFVKWRPDKPSTDCVVGN